MCKNLRSENEYIEDIFCFIIGAQNYQISMQNFWYDKYG